MVYIKTLKCQTMLIPQNICDLIPEDHICYLVESFVESLDYSEFDKYYSGAGNPAYPPRIFLKILVMGLLDRIRSSRRLEKSTNENIIYIYLSERTNPNFRTISNFRKTNPKLIKQVFKEIVKFIKSESLLDLSKIFIDGTKEKANASNKNVVTKEELEIVKNFVEKSLEEWEKQDKIEDEEFRKLRGFDQLPKNSKNKIKNLVKNYIEKSKQKGEDFKVDLEIKLDLAKKELDENKLDKVSLTDVESRFMLNKKGKIELSYNPQITTDKNGFIIANEVVQDANDVNQLMPQIELVEENVGKLEQETPLGADAGYDSATNLKELKNKGLDGYIPNKELSKKTKEEHKKKS
jgi:transposase